MINDPSGLEPCCVPASRGTGQYQRQAGPSKGCRGQVSLWGLWDNDSDQCDVLDGLGHVFAVI